MKLLAFKANSFFHNIPRLAKFNYLSAINQRAYSTSTLSMEQVVKNFYQKSVEQGEDQLTLPSVIKTMKDLLQSEVTVDDHSQYQAVADELAFYVERFASSQKKYFLASLQIKTLLDFGSTFGISSRDYWKYVQSSIMGTLDQMQCQDILTTLTQMKHLGILSNQIIKKAINLLKDMLPKATTSDLAIFTMLYTSSDVQSALVERDRNFEDKLEYYLTRQIDSKALQPDEFALICNAIAFQDSDVFQEENPIYFDTVLTSSINQVQEWIKENAFSMTELGYIIEAYSQLENADENIKSKLFGDFESVILENCQQLKLKNAVDLVQAMHRYASKELMEVFDRIIGKNIYELPINELIPTIKAFLSSENTRDKIYSVLFSHVKRNLRKFSLQEQCDLAYMLTFFEHGEFSDLYDQLEPFIISKIHELKDNQIVMLLAGYYNQNLTKRFEILNILEAMILKKIDVLSAQTVTQVLYFYSKSRFGEKVIIESLIQRLKRESEENISQIDPKSLVQIVITLNMSGADTQIISKYKGAFLKNIDQYTNDELALIRESIPVEDKQFDDLREAISSKL